jgi:hypothetical protein
MPLHIGGVGFQLVRDMPEAIGEMRLDDGDTPELGCGHPIKRCGLPQGTQHIGINCHVRNLTPHREAVTNIGWLRD